MAMTAPGTRAARPIPEGFHTLTPTLIVKGAADALDFYARAFGAKEISRAASPDGSMIMHAEIQIGDSRLMLSDEFPEMACLSPLSIGGSASGLHIYVEDTDALFQQAIDAGAKADMPPMDMFWGDRYGKLTDPFGHSWSIATHLRDLTEEELQQAMTEAFAAGTPCASES